MNLSTEQIIQAQRMENVALRARCERLEGALGALLFAYTKQPAEGFHEQLSDLMANAGTALARSEDGK